MNDHTIDKAMESFIENMFHMGEAILTANLDGELSAHALEGVVILHPGKMDAMQVFRLVDELYSYGDKLIDHLVEICGECDDPENAAECIDGTVTGRQDITLPEWVREKAGFAKRSALNVVIDKKSGHISIFESAPKYSLDDIPGNLLDAFIASEGCVVELAKHMSQGDVVYGE
ncbi:MAG: hypothetical protein J6K03_09805 [Oscillospiraceae bacterium]|nr:hypothetical protein [Oscillospiraceae bacterium]